MLKRFTLLFMLLLGIAATTLVAQASSIKPNSASDPENTHLTAMRDGFYLGTHGGISAPGGDDDFDKAQTGFGLGIQLGYRISNLRIAESADYAQSKEFRAMEDSSSGFYKNINSTNHIQNYMTNVYYDFHWDDHFVPFVGLGLGVLIQKTNTDTILASVATHTARRKTSFAYQGMIGIGCQAQQHVWLSAAYHYLQWHNVAHLHLSLFEIELSYQF